MICACLLTLWAKCFTDNPRWHAWVERNIVAEAPKGPWGYRPDDPADWNVDWSNWDEKKDDDAVR